MDECPHCGEPIDEDAEACHHCGSDFETGWKADQDYYALELPEDDADRPPEYGQEAPGAVWESLVSWCLVAASGLAFLGASYHFYRGPAALAFGSFLVVCIAIFVRLVSLKRRTAA